MQNRDLKSMSVDALWHLHQHVAAELSRKIRIEKARLDRRLRELGGQTNDRRPYPKVLPKYRNPKDPSQTWAGRGRQPRWVRALLRSGKKIDDFLIRRAR